MSAVLRLFVAARLGAAVSSGVARTIDRARGAAPHAKWVAPDAAHLTLAFLGGVPAAQVPAITAALARAAEGHRPLSLDVGAAGTFGRASSPRVLWLGIGGDVDALAALQRDVAAVLAPLGVPPEDRAFHPHLTLARARDPRGDRSLARAAERLGGLVVGTARVTHVVVMESHLGPGGARYDALAELPLCGV